ncbi:MAG: hypothetical protein DHS20C15_17610 [Planctomycetota bacterium]|nr:MAG: hypothetical protein DHS20C15_17610 [Planctomycetota bacterium]
MDFMFLVFAALAVIGGLVMAFHHSIVHSAFALVGALFGIAGLYWTLGADFLGALQLLLYVGGVTVLLLFGVMLTTRDSARISTFRYMLMAPVVGMLAYFMLNTLRGVYAVVSELGVDAAEAAPTTERIGEAFLDPDVFLLPFEVAAVLLLLVLIGAVTVARRGSSDEGAA